MHKHGQVLVATRTMALSRTIILCIKATMATENINGGTLAGIASRVRFTLSLTPGPVILFVRRPDQDKGNANAGH